MKNRQSAKLHYLTNIPQTILLIPVVTYYFCCLHPHLRVHWLCQVDYPGHLHLRAPHTQTPWTEFPQGLAAVTVAVQVV